jgi:hypothetical protein
VRSAFWHRGACGSLVLRVWVAFCFGGYSPLPPRGRRGGGRPRSQPSIPSPPPQAKILCPHDDNHQAGPRFFFLGGEPLGNCVLLVAKKKREGGREEVSEEGQPTTRTRAGNCGQPAPEVLGGERGEGRGGASGKVSLGLLPPMPAASRRKAKALVFPPTSFSNTAFIKAIFVLPWIDWPT